MRLRPATPSDLDAFVQRHHIGAGIHIDDNRVILERDGRQPADLGAWGSEEWWSRIKALAPTSWYVNEMIARGDWREEVIPAQMVGLSRDLAVLRASRKGDFIVSEWHGDRKTFCPPLYDDLAIGSGACGQCRACFLILTHRIRRDPWRHLLYDNMEHFWSEAAAWLKSKDDYTYTCKASTRRTLGMGIDRSDSLLFEGVTGHARNLIPLFANPDSNPDGRRLILLTRSANTHYLAGLPTSNVIVSMSLNPQSVADQWENVWPDGERVTRPIADRTEALVEAQRMGFEVRIRLDPILLIEGWEEAYSQFMAEAASAGLKPARITLGIYRRQNKQLQEWAQYWGLPPLGWRPRYMVRDGTHEHIPVEQRIATYRTVAEITQVVWPEAEIALCKETQQVWAAGIVKRCWCNCLA